MLKSKRLVVDIALVEGNPVDTLSGATSGDWLQFTIALTFVWLLAVGALFWGRTRRGAFGPYQCNQCGYGVAAKAPRPWYGEAFGASCRRCSAAYVVRVDNAKLKTALMTLVISPLVMAPFVVGVMIISVAGYREVGPLAGTVTFATAIALFLIPLPSMVLHTRWIRLGAHCAPRAGGVAVSGAHGMGASRNGSRTRAAGADTDVSGQLGLTGSERDIERARARTEAANPKNVARNGEMIRRRPTANSKGEPPDPRKVNVWLKDEQARDRDRTPQELLMELARYSYPDELERARRETMTGRMERSRMLRMVDTARSRWAEKHAI